MAPFSKSIKKKYFKSAEHPYRIFKNEIGFYLRPEHTLLDAGCGRNAYVLSEFKEKARKLIGVDLEDFDACLRSDHEVQLLNENLAEMSLADKSVDLITARCVLEHIKEPRPVYFELNRVLKPGGHFIFLTPNLGDYVTCFARMTPNKLHPWIVSKTKGCKKENAFPVYYKSNSFRAISQLAQKSGFELVSFDYLGQFPSYFKFNPLSLLMATGYEKLITHFDALKFLRAWLLVILKKT